MRTVKAAAVQLSPVLYSREGTVAKVVGKIHDLGWNPDRRADPLR
jgi:nitrilase